jgi:beta-phosphoglucomutase-like phosphatase (HAD superfamily)
MRRHGATGSRAEFDELNGPPLRTVLEVLKRRYCFSLTIEELDNAYSALVLNRYSSVKPTAGACALLDYCQRHCFALGLVTSNARPLARAFLRANAWDKVFAAVITAEDVRLGKPDPEPYMLALASLGLEPGNAFAVEDSPAGVRSSTGAGVATVFLEKERAPAAPAHPLIVARVSSLSQVIGVLQQEVTHGAL